MSSAATSISRATGIGVRVASACAVCGASGAEVVIAVDSVPANCSAMHLSADDARQAQAGRLELALCDGCGYVWNNAFDESSLTYDPSYENALDFSPAFRQYLGDLADELVDRYALEGRHVVELGCGQGSFLQAICEGREVHGTGFDPSFRGELALDSRVRVVPALFEPETTRIDGDLYCARHVLEHISDPKEFVSALHRAAAGTGAALYLEVPAGESVFGGDSCWDLVYPHVSFFGAPALAELLGRCGFSVTAMTPRFGGQYLSAEAVPGTPGRGVERGEVERFALQVRTAAATLEDRLAAVRAAIAGADGPVAMWGAGAKAVTFLSLLGQAVDLAVDVNPRKHGTFLPGSGLAVCAPERLVELRPALVIILNPLYRQEIEGALAALGLSPAVVAA